MMKTAFRLFALSGALAALPVNPALAQETTPLRLARPQIATTEEEITPPPSVAAQAKPDAVILKPGRTSTVIKSLAVKRRYTIPALRSRPVIALGDGKVDMTPVFRNPASPLNIAPRLLNLPTLVEGVSQDAEVVEVEQGLVVRQFLSYRVKPGTCSNPARRVQLERSGVECFSRLSPEARAAAFANPQDPHYVADRSQRAKAIAIAAEEAEAERKDFASGIAEFRAMMQNPAKRAQVEAEVGAGEAARLAALSDDALEEELVNSAETQIEDVMFLPARGKLEMQQRASMGRVTSRLQRLQPPEKPEKVDAEHALQSHIFLTGFTLGRNNEWRRRVSVTVKTCLVSCKKTYYIELFAGFNYGFGLRFPIRVNGLYTYHREGDQESATVAPAFEPIDGDPGDFGETGLPNDKMFEAQELVAELHAYAGIAYKVPFHSGSWTAAEIGPDLAASLPAPFTHGQFRPPAPGSTLNADIVLNNPDLLGGLANYGVVGAKILPAVSVGLTSDRLRLKLKDNISGEEKEMLNSGQAYPLKVNPQDHSSDFTIGFPEYSLQFQMTPGLAARLFVDVAVWSKHWDWPVWFPDIAVTLPPKGVPFTCHEGTICSRNYHYSPTVSQESIGEGAPPTGSAIELFVYKWRKDYRQRWIHRCPELTWAVCGFAISSQAQLTGNQMQTALEALQQYPSNEGTVIIVQKTIEADKQAEAIILEHKVVAAEHFGKDFIALNEPVWGRDCADQLCRTRIHALGVQYIKALQNRQQTSPKLKLDEVVVQENTAGNWAGKAQQEVEASKKRAKPTIRQMPRLRVN